MQIPSFWRTGAWLPRVVTTNDIQPIFPGQNHIPWLYSAAFIYPAYEGDSASNLMLTWYKVICVIGQSKFEV